MIHQVQENQNEFKQENQMQKNHKDDKSYSRKLSSIMNYSIQKRSPYKPIPSTTQHNSSQKQISTSYSLALVQALNQQHRPTIEFKEQREENVSFSRKTNLNTHKRYYSNLRNHTASYVSRKDFSDREKQNTLSQERISMEINNNISETQVQNSPKNIQQKSSSSQNTRNTGQQINYFTHSQSSNNHESIKFLNKKQSLLIPRYQSPSKSIEPDSLREENSDDPSGSFFKQNSQEKLSLTEGQKQIMNEFLKSSSWEKQEMEILKNAVKELLESTQKLERECRRLSKENRKQKKMLEILQLSNQMKDNFFQKMNEQTISIKSELDNLKLQKTQLQQIEVIKSMKQNIQIVPSTQKNKDLTVEIFQNQPTYQNNSKWVSMKKVLEDKNSFSQSHFQVESLSNSNKKLVHSLTVQQSGQNSPNITSAESISTIGLNSKAPKTIKNARASIISTGSESQERKSLRPQFIQHSTDSAFYASALDLAVRDKEIIDYFVEGKYMKFLKGHFSDETNLQKLIYNLEGQTFKFFYESVNQLLGNIDNSIQLILKSKNVVRCIYALQRKMNISEAFDSLSIQCSKILNSEKVQIFLLDEKSNLFWTKGIRNNEMVKISLEGSGFCYHVAKSGQVINVLDAHLDDRFDKTIDQKNNTKTKSVLCAPIFDSHSHHYKVIGILQAVNKNDQTFFTKDDEGIIKVIALLSENILKNSVFNDERAEFYNSLRFLYSYSIDAIQAQSASQLTEISYVFLQNSLNIAQSRIILFDKNIQQFYTYFQGNQTYFETTQGVVGKVFFNETISVNSNISEDIDFNNLIDIDTQLPVVSLPIFQSSSTFSHTNKPSPIAIEEFFKLEQECIGVLQVINSRGISSLIMQQANQSKVLLTNYETLQRFNLLYAAALARLI